MTRLSIPAMLPAWRMVGARRPGLARWLDPVRALSAAGAVLLAILFVLTSLDTAGLAMWWELGHWTISAAFAVAIALVGARRGTGEERRARALACTALMLYLAGQLTWNVQVAAGLDLVPAPSDLFFLGMAAPFLAALAFAVHASGSRGELRTFALDATILAAAIMAHVFFAFEPIASGTAAGLGLVLLLYPIVYFGLSGAMIVAALLMRAPPGAHGLYLASAGTALLGLNWVWFLSSAIAGQPTTGSPVNMLGSVATIMIGLGVAGWRSAVPSSERVEQFAARVLMVIPVGAIGSAALIHLFAEPIDVVEAAAAAVVLLAIVRQTLLLGDQRAFAARERVASARERELREGAQQALAARETSEARYRTLVDVFNRLGEQTTFAADEDEMFVAAAAALGKLVPAPDGGILAINASADRLSVRVAWGTRPSPPGTAVDVDAPGRCFGIRRGSVVVIEDADEAWTPACPAFPVDHGSAACVPMVAAGTVIGVVHLARAEPRAFTEDDLRQAGRIAEQAALAVSNARLLRTMEGLAMTDGLTGLHNGRFFDPFLDRELAIADREGIPIGVIVIDLDHFKRFNDTHGHPAGDEALRAFARACLGVLRSSDTMARMGGEEFSVAVRGADLAQTTQIAEKLRFAVEQRSIDIGSGRLATMTASFGVASSAEHGTHRKRLMRVADRALYAAKRAGRNTVVAGDVQRKTVRRAGPLEVGAGPDTEG